MEVDVKITRKKIKNLILKVNHEGKILLSVPWGTSDEMIEGFLKREKNWIIERFKELEENKKKISKFENGEMIEYLGKKYTLKMVDSKKNSVAVIDEEIYIYSPSTLSTSEKKKIFEEWGTKQLASLLKDIVKLTAEKVGYSPNTITIKNMKTRWGSCNSIKKSVVFNCQLMYKPISVIEYIVLHELAHIPHPHHQKEFWAFVEKYMPDWKERRKLLKSR